MSYALIFLDQVSHEVSDDTSTKLQDDGNDHSVESEHFSEDQDENENYPLGRLVEDLLVLCAAIHSSFESGYISKTDFRIEINTGFIIHNF